MRHVPEMEENQHILTKSVICPDEVKVIYDKIRENLNIKKNITINKIIQENF
jgi:hypothetical protein